MTRNSIKLFFTELKDEVTSVTWELYKLMIPTLIVVKALEELGALHYFSLLLAPVMSLVGLPESMGIVWATTILTNLYAGMLVFFNMAQTENLSVAQVTVLCLMLLLSHALPIEALIARRAGIRLAVTLSFRIGASILFAALLNQIYSQGKWLQEPSEMTWQPEQVDDSFLTWAITQVQSLFMIFLLIIILLTLLKLIRLVGIERLIEIALAPFLKVMGISRQATTITLIGMTLGLSFGGGLLIKEAEAGHISKRDIFASLTLLALCHSIIEDTLLVLLLGADILGILWFRLAFTLLTLALITRWLKNRSDDFVATYLFHNSDKSLPLQTKAKAKIKTTS